MLDIWKFLLNKKSFSYLLLVAFLSFGIYSMVTLPKESNPEVQIPVAVVSVPFPGASASDVEKLITEKIEDALDSNLDDVNKITSNSKEGLSSVTVEFNAQADIDSSIQDVKDEVDKVKVDLPKDALEPIVSDVNFVDQPVLIISLSSDLPVTEFIKLTDDVVDELKQVKGVSKISKSGIPSREVQVLVDKERLHNFNVDILSVIRGLAASNVSLPIGNIEVSDIDYAVRFEGDIKDTKEIGDIAVLNIYGKPVYLRDIAFVSDGTTKQKTFTRISKDGQPSEQAVALAVFKRSGGNVVKMVDDIKNKVSELQNGILADSSVLYSFDTANVIKKDLSNLSFTGLQTVILVIIVLFFVIGFRESIIAGLAIPISFLIAFIGLSASGNTINFVSLFSLILAVGILVDSAIVITEGIHTNLQKGYSKKESALVTLKEFNWPLISGTMTTIAVFAPLFFISGVTGKFIAIIPFTVIFVLSASLFVALGFIPLIASTFLKAKNKSEFSEKQEFYTKKVQEWYKNKLSSLLGDKKKEFRFFWIITALLFVALALPATGVVKTIFFTQENADFLFVDISKNEGTLLPETDLATRAVEEVIYDQKDVASFVTTVGAGSSFNNGGVDTRLANITLILKDKKERSKTSTEILEELRIKLADFKDAKVVIVQPSGGPPSGAPVLVKLFSDNFNDLEVAVSKVEDILKNIDGVTDVESSAQSDSLEFVFKLDKEKASELGVSPETVAQVLRSAIYGTKATTIKTDKNEDIDVVVKLALNPNYKTAHETINTTPDTLKQIEISTPKGPVLLGSLVDVSLAKSSNEISHEARKRIYTVSSQVREGKTAGEITDALSEKMKSVELPESVEMSIGGEKEDVNRSFTDMFIALIVGMILVVAILVLQFNSYKQAAFIISIVPLSLIGIFFGLALTHNALSFPSIMGFIALSGIVVNNSIILVDVINSLRKEDPKRNLKNAVIEGSVSRLRPILLTTVTTIVGIFPLTYASDLWAPLAFSIMFGLSFTVIITLFFVPMLYNRFSKTDIIQD